jgi:hypothetical protein
MAVRTIQKVKITKNGKTREVSVNAWENNFPIDKDGWELIPEPPAELHQVYVDNDLKVINDVPPAADDQKPVDVLPVNESSQDVSNESSDNAPLQESANESTSEQNHALDIHMESSVGLIPGDAVDGTLIFSPEAVINEDSDSNDISNERISQDVSNEVVSSQVVQPITERKKPGPKPKVKANEGNQ